MQFRLQSPQSLTLKVLLDTLRVRSIKMMNKGKRIEGRKGFSEFKEANKGS